MARVAANVQFVDDRLRQRRVRRHIVFPVEVVDDDRLRRVSRPLFWPCGTSGRPSDGRR